LRDALAVKDSQLVKFQQEYHQMLESNLVQQEKEMKERLMSEIKSSYRGGGDSMENEFEVENLRILLEQERIEN
jgi:hypothetical protein